ncbi:MAG: hypothetical protein ACLTMP_10255 [Eggerthella lenta]
MHDNARHKSHDQLSVIGACLTNGMYLLGEEFSLLDIMLARCSGARPTTASVAARRRAADDLRRTPLLAPCLHRLDDAVRARDAPLIG